MTMRAIARRSWWLATLLILAAITGLSLAPLPTMPLAEVRLGDKLNHFAAYALLALPVSLARPRLWPLVLLGFVAWSGAIELVQPRVNRRGEWADLLANATGLALGAAIAALLRRARAP